MGLLGKILGTQRKVQFIVNDASGLNTVIQFDASIKEEHKRESPVTQFPVEDGNVISDHVLIRPFKLQLTGIISDTPIGGVDQLLTEVASVVTASLLPPIGVIAAAGGYAAFQALSQSQQRSVANYVQLLQLQAMAKPFDVSTSLYYYPSMWISNITAPRDADTGRALLFTVDLEQLILVSPQAVNVQIFANPALASNQANLGSNEPSPWSQGVKWTDKTVQNLSGGVPPGVTFGQ